MKEGDLMRHIQIECCRDPEVRLWRNNNGQAYVGTNVTSPAERYEGLTVLKNARVIRFGLGEGTGDLIGARSVIITPGMVDRRVFVFSSIEVKMPRGRATEQQKTFVHVVKSLGGIADIVRSAEEARQVLTGKL